MAFKKKNTIPKNRWEHGGSTKTGRRRLRRPLSPKKSHHLVLRSDFARGPRDLLRNYKLVQGMLRKSSRRFRIHIYEQAVVGNHIHLLVKGQNREDLQNFFRVFAGHLAQKILEKHPIRPNEMPMLPPKNRPPLRSVRRENKFWETRIYTRVVAWGRDFEAVGAYLIMNTKEALGLVPYRTRRRFGEPRPV